MGRSSHAWLAVVLLSLVALLGPSLPLGTTAHPSAGPHPVDPGTAAQTVARAGSDPRPSAGTVLLRNGVSPTMASLSWTKSTSLLFSSYEVTYSSGGSSGPWSLVANITTASQNYTWVDGQVPKNTTWWEVTVWTLLIVDYTGTPSNVLQITQPPVANLTGHLANATTVQLNWTNSALYGGNLSFSRYALYEVAGTAAPRDILNVSSEAIRHATVTNLTPGAGYSFYVSTADAGASPQHSGTFESYSNTVSFGTPEPLQASAHAAPSAIDAGQQVAFTCLPTGGFGTDVINWTFGDGTNGSGSPADHTYSSVGNLTATCTVTDASNTTVHASVAVSVSADLSVRAIANETAVGLNTSVGFVANWSGGPSSTPVVQWAFGDGSTSSGVSGVHAFGRTGQFVVEVSATDSNGGVAAASVDVNVTNLTSNVNQNRTSALVGSGVLFGADAAGGAGAPFNFTWSFGDGSIGYGAHIDHVYRSAAMFSPSVRIADRLGADVTRSLEAVEIYSALSSNLVLPSANPVPNQRVNLSVAVTGGNGVYTCSWTLGDGGVSSECAVTHAWSKAGTYVVNVTVSSAVAGNVTRSAHLTVAAAPTSVPPPTTSTPPTKGSSSPASFPSWLIWAVLAACIATVGVLYLARRRFARHSSSTAPAAPAPIPHDACVHCGAAVAARILICPNCRRPPKAT